RMWSRWEDCSGMSSTILMTLTSLLSCLVTCSKASPSASTTTVMRERPSTSDGPTVSDSMLNARRAKSPATRVRTPGTSWTSTERVWRCMLVLLVPIRGHVPGYLNFIVGNSRWDHGPDHGVGRDHEINKDGAVVDFHSPFDGRGNIGFFFYPNAYGTVGFSEFDEVWDPNAVGTGVQIGVGIPGVVEQGLPLTDHAQRGGINEGDLVNNAGSKFLVGHLEATIPIDGPDRTVGFGHLGAHGRWDGKAHGAKSSGVHPLVWPLVADKLCTPHLVLAHTCYIDGFGTGNFRKGLDDFLWCHQSIIGWGVTQGVGGPCAIDDVPPFGQIRGAMGIKAIAHLLSQLRQDGFDITNDGNISCPG